MKKTIIYFMILSLSVSLPQRMNAFPLAALALVVKSFPLLTTAALTLGSAYTSWEIFKQVNAVQHKKTREQMRKNHDEAMEGISALQGSVSDIRTDLEHLSDDSSSFHSVTTESISALQGSVSEVQGNLYHLRKESEASHATSRGLITELDKQLEKQSQIIATALDSTRTRVSDLQSSFNIWTQQLQSAHANAMQRFDSLKADLRILKTGQETAARQREQHTTDLQEIRSVIGVLKQAAQTGIRLRDEDRDLILGVMSTLTSKRDVLPSLRPGETGGVDQVGKQRLAPRNQDCDDVVPMQKWLARRALDQHRLFWVRSFLPCQTFAIQQG